MFAGFVKSCIKLCKNLEDLCWDLKDPYTNLCIAAGTIQILAGIWTILLGT